MKTFITAQLRHENVMDNYQISFRKETPENETKILLSYWNLVNILLAYIVTTFKKMSYFLRKVWNCYFCNINISILEKQFLF